MSVNKQIGSLWIDGWIAKLKRGTVISEILAIRMRYRVISNHH